MDQEIFADAIGEIRFENGVFRIDLVSIAPPKDNINSPAMVFKQRIVMPPEGFVRSFATMEKVVKKMLESGVIKRQEPKKDAPEIKESAPTPPSFS